MSANSTVRVIFLGDAASAVRSVSTLEGRMGSLGATAGRTGKLLAGAIGISLAGSLIKATSLAIGFDREMRNVNSIAHLNEKQFQALSKQVLALGKVSGQAPKVLASGLYDIVSSGFKASDALKVLHASAIAATAGQTDVATASKGVTAVLNAYGLGADKARNVSSLLFKEVQLGVNTFGDLASQLGDTAPIAAALKIPFSDVAAGLALITLHGTPVTEASTQMARVMTDLLKPSKALSTTLHSLGYENGQAAIQAHGFVPLIEQLSKAAGGPDGAAVKTADWFQNIRSLRGMLNLTGPNLKKFNDFARQMAKSFRDGGDDVRAFNEQSKSISVRWDKAVAGLSAGAIKLGTNMFPVLITGIGYLSDFAGWLDKLSGEHSIKAKIEFIGSSAEEYASHVKSLLSQALLGGNKGADNPSTQRLQQPGMPVDLKFQTGFVQKAQDQILKMGGWSAIGTKIGAAIGAGLVIGRDQLGKISTELVAWADGPGGHQAGLVGATIAANVVSTLLDPGFWVHHWQLAFGIALAVMPVGRLAKIGELFAEGAFKLFGTSVGRIVIAGLGRLPGIVGDSAPRFAGAIGSMVEKAGIAGTGKFVEWAARAMNAITGAFGRLGGLLKVVFYTAIVGGVAGLAGQLYTAAIGLGESIASGVLHGLAGLPGKIASAIIPGGGGAHPAVAGGHPTITHKATGGVIDKPMLAMIGEDAPRFAEFIIPTNPKYRDRAMGLLGQANSMLGMPGFATGGGPKKKALFSHEGPDLYGAAYAHNSPFAKKGPYQTKLSKGQEKAFDAWVKQYRVPFDIGASVTDYDMRGYWKATGGKPFRGGHFPDTWKTPYDTSFSSESRYATKNNPFVWQGNALVDKRNGNVVFGAFAAGGGPKKGSGHHYAGHQLRKPKGISTKGMTGAAGVAMTKLTAAQARVADLGRTYDQDSREFGTVTLPPLTLDVLDDPNDPTGSTHQVINPAGIQATVAQLTSLISEKGGILGALDTEKQRIEDAIKAVKDAIDALLKAIADLQTKAHDAAIEARRQHGLASQSSLSVSKKGGLQDQVTAERAKKKPSKARIAQLEAQIKQAGRSHDDHESLAKAAETAQGRYQKQAETDAGKLGDLRGSLTDLTQQQHDLPFDVRDQQIDIEDLQKQIRDVQATSVSPFSPTSSSTGGSSSSGGGSSITDAITQDMAARLATYAAALGLQGRQLGVLGAMPSFDRGAIHIPNDMVAQLHSGESVRTRDQTAADMRNQTGGPPIHVQINLSGPLAPLSDFVQAEIISAVPNITSAIGRSADLLRRSGRTA